VDCLRRFPDDLRADVDDALGLVFSVAPHVVDVQVVTDDEAVTTDGDD